MQPGMEMCRGCRQPFVDAVALLDLVDEGLYLLALHCNNCDRLAVGIHEDADLEQLEASNDRATAQIEAALEIVEVSRFIDDVGSFRRALEEDLVLPEDF
jgi:hypothetical protein